MEQGKRYAVFSIRKIKPGNSVWTRAGSAFINKDGSMNVYLDVLPMDGQLHVREPGEKRDVVGSVPLGVPAEESISGMEWAAQGGH